VPVPRGVTQLLFVISVVACAPEAHPEAEAAECHYISSDLTDPQLRDVVFEGVLIGHREKNGAEWSVFLVRRSWKGAASDTLSVPTPPPVGPPASRAGRVGAAYLVFADVDRSGIVYRSCDRFLRLSGEGQRLEELGAPRRVLTSEGLESLSSGAVRPRTGTPPGQKGGMPVTLSVVGEHGVVWGARVGLGNEEQDTDVFGRVGFDGLPEGLYEGQVAVGETIHPFHLLLACVEESAQCREVRGTIRLRPEPPGGPRSLLAEEIVFTPFSVAPELLNHDEIERLLRSVLPDAELLIPAGSQPPDAVLEFWLLLDESGAVMRVQLRKSSARPDVDSAVISAAMRARFTPARNREHVVPAWIPAFVMEKN
jgi:TonB family protein